MFFYCSHLPKLLDSMALWGLHENEFKRFLLQSSSKTLSTVHGEMIVNKRVSVSKTALHDITVILICMWWVILMVMAI